MLLSEFNFDLNTLMIIVWIVFIIVTGVVELVTTDLVTIWFTLGAIGSLIAAFFKVSVPFQFVIFIGLSIVFVLATRPIAKRLQTKEIIKTNADKVVGQMAIVTTEIKPNDFGEVKVEGKIWRAISNNEKVYKVDEKVKVLAISGVKLIVDDLEDKKEVIL